MQQQSLIVTQAFNHVQNAAFPELRQSIPFHKFETISLNGSPHYIDPVGWYIPLVNSTTTFHMSSDKLEEYYREGYVTTYDDLILKRNYLQYKVNQSLDVHDKDHFSLYASQLNEIEMLLSSYGENKNPVA
ncbi:hypothetical protein [Halobacillus sp. Marseille-P3879]|uniref:hypothetical protein n=1 Tax=Halobacillus sp. Marseille-P3879 TaxID=2045014 RepID=UPI000C7E40DB|nr:hypothetical protein [Halobacillus sp. Marseille-P3879]